MMDDGPSNPWHHRKKTTHFSPTGEFLTRERELIPIGHPLAGVSIHFRPTSRSGNLVKKP